jgi:hypothetical protein
VEERFVGLETITRQVPETGTLDTEVTDTELSKHVIVEVMEDLTPEI